MHPGAKPGVGRGVIPWVGGRGGFFKKRGAQLLPKIFPQNFDFFSRPPPFFTTPNPHKISINKNSFTNPPHKDFSFRITLFKPVFPKPEKRFHRYYFSKKIFRKIFQLFPKSDYTFGTGFSQGRRGSLKGTTCRKNFLPQKSDTFRTIYR